MSHDDHSYCLPAYLRGERTFRAFDTFLPVEESEEREEIIESWTFLGDVSGLRGETVSDPAVFSRGDDFSRGDVLACPSFKAAETLVPAFCSLLTAAGFPPAGDGASASALCRNV